MLIPPIGKNAALCLSICIASFLLAPQDVAARRRPTHLPASEPQFSHYPARTIFKGKPAAVILDSAQARKFRTRLREDSQRGPNFAGHYTIVFWGCGSGCAQLAAVDAFNGKIVWLPLDWVDIPDKADVTTNRNFHLDSKLLVVTRSNYDAHATFTAYYYVLNHNRLRMIKKLKVHNSQP